MSERVWNGAAGKTWPDFEERLAVTDAMLENLARTVHWTYQGLSNAEERMFEKSFTLTMTAAEAGTIRYTIDGKPPTAESPEYKAPVTIEQAGYVRAGLFNGAGKQVGPLSEDHFRKVGK